MLLKEFIRKTHFLSAPAKRLFDENRERQNLKKINKFLKFGLDYTKTCPEKIEVGHEPTIRCNLKCRMCYQGQTRSLRNEELDASMILEVYKKIESRTLSIKLVGGEPFMRSDIFDLIDFWAAKNVTVDLQTNLTLIGEAAVQKLKKYKNIKAILTSLDGPREIHDAVRGVPGAFNNMVRAAKLIRREMPGVELSIFSMILLAEKWGGAYAVCDLAKELGLGSVQFLFEQVNMPGAVSDSKKMLLEKLGWLPDEYRVNTQIRNELFEGTSLVDARRNLKSLRGYGFKKGCFANFLPFNFYKNLDVYMGLRKKRVFCTKLLFPQIRIVQTGEVVWCDILEKSFGNLTRASFEEIWLSPAYQQFREFLKNNSLPVCERCCRAVYLD